MFKRIISGLCFLAFINILPALADSAPITEDEARKVEAFFNSYVESGNNYRDDFIDYYEDNADIERVVIKPDGAKEAVKIPMERYKKELKSGKKAARLVRYKNTYVNKRYEKIDDGKFKITTTRIPFKDKTGLNAEFIVNETPEGLKISAESMETNVQKFLHEK